MNIITHMESIVSDIKTVHPNFHGVAGKSGRPSLYAKAKKNEFTGMCWNELHKLLEKHNSGELVLKTDEIIKLCQPIVLKDMAEKVEIENLNELSGEQKYSLMMRYLETLPIANRPAITA